MQDPRQSFYELTFDVCGRLEVVDALGVDGVVGSGSQLRLHASSLQPCLCVLQATAK
jgi:hypothetical protein